MNVGQLTAPPLDKQAVCQLKRHASFGSPQPGTRVPEAFHADLANHSLGVCGCVPSFVLQRHEQVRDTDLPATTTFTRGYHAAPNRIFRLG